MKKSRSQELRAAVKELLVPHIQSLGFGEDSREIWKQDAYGHLFCKFLRWNGNRMELLNIQFDKHGRAKFVLNFGVVPPDGVEYYGHHCAQQDATVGHLHQQARLYAGNRFTMRWFGFPLLRLPLLRSPTSPDIVHRAIRLFPQVDAWLKDGIVGPNVRVLDISAHSNKYSKANVR